LRCVYQSGLKETTDYTDKKHNSSAPHLASPLPLSPPQWGGQGEETFFPRPLWEGLGEGAELLPKNTIKLWKLMSIANP